MHGDLRAAAGLTGGTFNLNNSFINFWSFLLEQFDEETRMGTGQNDLRPLVRHFHVKDISADTVALPIALPRNLFFLRQHRIGTAKVDDDVFLFYTLDDP